MLSQESETRVAVGLHSTNELHTLPNLFCAQGGRRFMRTRWENISVHWLRENFCALGEVGEGGRRPHGVAVALRIPNPTTAVRFRLRSLSQFASQRNFCIRMRPNHTHSPMAQSVARQAVNLQVAGSNPAGGAFCGFPTPHDGRKHDLRRNRTAVVGFGIRSATATP